MFARQLFMMTVVMMSSFAFAAETKHARSNDLAETYTLSDDGTLSRAIRNSNLKCTITTNVDEFKVSMHKNDAAMIYFVKNDKSLWYLKNSGSSTSQCPPAEKQRLMQNVKKYTVTSNTDTEVVNVALDTSGNLYAWGNSGPAIYSDTGVAEFQMNQCYGASGKSFNSFVMFTRDAYGIVTKVKVEQGRYFINNDSRDDARRFPSITDFKKERNVCQ